MYLRLATAHWWMLAVALLAASPAAGETVVCHQCMSNGASWAPMIAAVEHDLGIELVSDGSEADEAASETLMGANTPVADIAYLGATSGIQAKEQNALQAYKPRGSDEVQAELKDAESYWHAVHSGTLGFFVNKEALHGKPVPLCWLDLLKSDYRGKVAYFDPSAASVGYVTAIAVNLAFGGPRNDFGAAVGFLRELGKNGAIVINDVSDAGILSGDIAVLLDYDFNAYRAKYTQKGNFEFVLPCEGSVVFPFVMCLLNGAPHKNAAERVLDYLVSPRGQAVWTSAYARPVRPVALPPAMKARFLPDSDYARAKSVDWTEMESYERAFVDRYLAEAR